jgi:hypothetical protein
VRSGFASLKPITPTWEKPIELVAEVSPLGVLFRKCVLYDF